MPGVEQRRLDQIKIHAISDPNNGMYIGVLDEHDGKIWEVATEVDTPVSLLDLVKMIGLP